MQTQVDELTRQNQTGLYKKSKSKKMGNMEGADFRIEARLLLSLNAPAMSKTSITNSVCSWWITNPA